LLIALVLDVLYEIIGREFLPSGGSAWTAEIAGWLLVWIVFLGGSLSVRDDTEPAVEALVVRLPESVTRWLVPVTDAIATFVFGYLLVYGIKVVLLVKSGSAPASGLSFGYLAAAIPTGAALMLYFKLVRYARHGLRGIPILVIVTVLGAAAATHRITLGGGAFYYLSVLGLLLLIAVGLPIAEAMVVAGAFSLTLTSPFASNIAYVQQISDGLNDFTFVAVPLFLLTGTLIAHTGAASKLAAFARSWLGWLPGGLAVADVGASAIFADISGSPVADTVALGSTMIPEMEAEGYPLPFATGLQAAAGTLGVMFPPSISTLIYASVANVSVGRIFAALLIPGILVALSFMFATVMICRRNGWGSRTPFRLRPIGGAGLRAFPALLTVVVVLGGIFSGLFTSSEAGAVAVLYILAVAALGYRRKGVPFLVPAMTEAIRNTGRVGFIIAAALAFGKALTANNGPQELVSALAGVSHNQYVLMLILLGCLVFVSTVIEPSTTPLVVIPVLLPVLTVAGVDLVHFGVLMQLDGAAALLLPPLGLCLFLVASIAGVRIEQAAKWAVPYISALIIDLLLVMFIHPLTTWLPNILGV
jgi:tripartite ATP-independent transporter DctM subunit